MVVAMLKKPYCVERLADEFNFLVASYPQIAFNHKTWTGELNDRTHGKRHLYATEGYITIPKNYDMDIISQYDTFITPNSKFKALHPELNIVVTSGPMRTDDFYNLERFLPYEDRIKGIASFLKYYNTGREGDILQMRHDSMVEFAKQTHLKVHAYGPVCYGNPENYFPDPGASCLDRGKRLLENWKIMNHYMFCWCPEPMYHELWSWDWVTERLMNCWKSKVVPVYYGAYNIDERVPDWLYIDFRKFNFDYIALVDYLLGLPKSHWEDMVEDGYAYEKTCRIGNIEDIEVQLRKLK